MKKYLFIVCGTLLVSSCIFSQDSKQARPKPQTQSQQSQEVQAQSQGDVFTIEKNNPATPVKSQGQTGTCWSFSTTSLLESQFLKTNKSDIDLSEMFTVYNIYIEKAKNYMLRQGHAQFGEGGLGHDVIRSMANYGAIPDTAFSGLKGESKTLNHSKMVYLLKEYLDNLLKTTPVAADWMDGYKKILDDFIGAPPAEFQYQNKKYTPKTFASEVLKFRADDYINITSFTHHPFYTPFIVEVPDNFSNGSYYNLPVNEMIQLVKGSITKGYTIMWDADVSNNGFMSKNGLALFIDRAGEKKNTSVSADMDEMDWTPALRQQYYENLTTQDDHLMHITGIEKSKKGKTFFIVKNSWGVAGTYKGYVNVSESYFAMNTISLVVPKEAIDKTLLLKLGISVK